VKPQHASQTHTESSAPRRRTRRAIHPTLAWAGIVGPMLFTAVFLAQEFSRRGEYDPMAEPVSALEAGPAGWIQQVNFLIFGVLTIAHAVGQHAGMLPMRRGVAGPVLLAITGIGALISGTFPLYEDAAGVTQFPVGHRVGGLTFFLISPAALIVLSRSMRRDPAWRPLARYTFVSGVVLAALAVVTLVLVLPDDALLHDWAGLIQRITILAVLFPCRIILSIRLLSMARDQIRRGSPRTEWDRPICPTTAPGSRSARSTRATRTRRPGCWTPPLHRPSDP
jgi:hypothetical membrane protein